MANNTLFTEGKKIDIIPSKAVPSLVSRCLSMTATFETTSKPPDCYAKTVGNFDGAGLSFGALQWNFGTESLQPMLKEFISKYPDMFKSIFADKADEVLAVLAKPKIQQVAWCDSISSPKKSALISPYKEMFIHLGLTEQFQAIEINSAKQYFDKAIPWLAVYGVKSERAMALLFDIAVQNGSISSSVKQLILEDFKSVTDEVDKLRIIANRRAEAANVRWIEDVRVRKLTIANGFGTVHGLKVDLQKDFSITLNDAIV